MKILLSAMIFLLVLSSAVLAAGFLNVSITVPQNARTYVMQNQTFNVSVRVLCDGSGDCGNVTGTLRYNASGSEPDRNVSQALGGSPFFVTSPSENFTEVGRVWMTPGVISLGASVIDDVNGFVYFGTLTSPPKIIKVNITDFSLADNITLSDETEYINCAAIDSARQLAYFGTGFSTLTYPMGAVVVVNLSTFREINRIVFPGEAIGSMVIDNNSQFGYFGSYGIPGIIRKINLTSFTLVGNITMNVGEYYLVSSVIDLANGFAYFGAQTVPGIIVKINLSDFTRVGNLTLDTGEDEPNSAVIDSANGFAYFGTTATPGRVVKINLSSFTRVGNLTLNSGENDLNSAIIDSANGFAYFGTYTTLGRVVKINLSSFTRVGNVTLNSGESTLRAAAISTNSGIAYFGTDTNPGRVIKINLSDFTRISNITMIKVLGPLFTAVIDNSRNYAYLGSGSSPGNIIRFNLTSFDVAEKITLNAGENIIYSSVIDSDNQYAYFGTGNTTGSVIKINLSDFSRVGNLTFNTGEGVLRAAVIDNVNGFAYFGTATTPGRVVKINLSSFTRVGNVTLNSGENLLRSAIIDSANGFAYFGTATTPGRVVKINLSSFTRVGNVTLNSGESNLYAAAIDTNNGVAYFTTSTQPGRVVKINLTSFTRMGNLTLNGDSSSSKQLGSAAIDNRSQFLYFGTTWGFDNFQYLEKINIASFTVEKEILFNSTTYSLYSMFIGADNYLYLGTGGNAQKIIKVSLDPWGNVSQKCLTLTNGQTCEINWTVNATGATATKWNMDVNFTSNDATVMGNDTLNGKVNIVESLLAFLEVNLLTPLTAFITNVVQNTTFLVNATVYCRNTDCGYVNGTLRFNESSADPDAPVNVTIGDVPFYVNEIPALASKTCPSYLLADEFCNLTWTVNATGAIGNNWKLGVQFNASNIVNNTANATVAIAAPSVDFTIYWSSLSFGQMVPNTQQNAAEGNADNSYNISVSGGSADLYIRGTDLTNDTFNTSIGVGNITWSNTTNNYAVSNMLATTYQLIKADVQPGTNVTLWGWLNVPPVLAGAYRGTVTIAGVQNGQNP